MAKRRKKLRTRLFRVFYTVKIWQRAFEESNIGKTHKDVEAKTAEEALEKVMQELKMQVKKEEKDLGNSHSEHSDFSAAPVCPRCGGKGCL